MESSRFVVALWPGPDANRLTGKVFPDLKRDGLLLVQKLDPIVYAFGEQAAAWWREWGVEPEVIPAVFRDVGGSTPMPAYNRQWAYKLIAMQYALRRARQIVWLDLDMMVVRDLPPDFWGRLRRGAPMQAKLCRFRNVKCPWRVDGARKSTSNAFIYCRDERILTQTLQWCLAFYDIGNRESLYRFLEAADCAMYGLPKPVGRRSENVRKFIDGGLSDETAWMLAVDVLEGGWRGEKHYWDRGYDPPWYCPRSACFRTKRRNQVFVLRRYFDPNQVISYPTSEVKKYKRIIMNRHTTRE